MELLATTYFGNTVLDWLLGLGMTLLVFVALRLIKPVVIGRLRHLADKTSITYDDLVIDLLGATKWYVLFAIALFMGARMVVLPAAYHSTLKHIISLAILIQAVVWGSHVISFFADRYRAKQPDTTNLAAIRAITFFGKLVLYALVVILLLDNFGVDITSLVAGLGIGGVAVALALQNILGDLFSSLSIMLDKPFVIGDFVIIDSFMGTVENIGLKTTRMRSLSGEQLVFSNSDLLSSRIRNYKRMQERRALFTIGVTYQTPHESLAKIPAVIREIVEAQPDTRFDRAHFKDYGDFSLNFEVVYFMLVPDYNSYMDRQQAINLAIYKKFGELGIEFAYPTQTLFVDKASNG